VSLFREGGRIAADRMIKSQEGDIRPDGQKGGEIEERSTFARGGGSPSEEGKEGKGRVVSARKVMGRRSKRVLLKAVAGKGHGFRVTWKNLGKSKLSVLQLARKKENTNEVCQKDGEGDGPGRQQRS